jgi:Flp pilus assembly protein TadD
MMPDLPPLLYSALRAGISAALCMAIVASGCVGVPKRPESPDPPPPQAPQNSAPAESLDLAQGKSDNTNKSRATATPRQKFQLHIDFGRIFEGQGNYDGAINEYQDALAVVQNRHHAGLTPTDEALAHRRMAGALDRLGRFAQAEVHYKQALKRAQKDPRVWNDAGYSYYLQGRFAEAEIALKTALKLAPDDERIKTNLGLTLAAAGRSQEALPILSQSTGDAVGHANLGYLLAATGQLDLARQQYETALALRPDLALAQRALVRLDHQQKGTETSAASPVQVANNASPVAPPLDSEVQKAAPPRPVTPILPPPRPPLEAPDAAARP